MMPPRPERRSLASFALLLLLPLLAFCALTVFVSRYGLQPYPYAPAAGGDYYRYIPMAVQPFTSPNPLAHEPPFVWRILTPLLVYLLPVPTLLGFWIVTVASLIGTIVVLPWLLQAFGLSRPAMLGGTLAFVFLGPAAAFSLAEYQRVDALAFFLLTLALLFAVKGRGLLLLLTLCLLSFTKEVSFFGAVFALAWSWQQRDRRVLAWSWASLGASLAILIALHALIPANLPYSFWGVFLHTYSSAWQDGSFWQRPQLTFVGTWGIVLPLAAWHLWHPASIWRYWACGLLFALATLQVLVSWDIERVVVYAFPVMVAAAAFSIEDLAGRWHMSRWLLWVPVFVLELTWQYSYGPDYFFIMDRWHGLEVAAIALLTAGVLLWPLYRRMRARSQKASTQPSNMLQ